MKLTFMGATETVTGSKYLIEVDQKKFLVDCGLFQGLKKLRLRNWSAPPVDPASVDAVILTHAHIDHSGYLPRFIQQGFKGTVYCTPATQDLCSILLPDSGYLQEEEAERANKYRYSKHHPALPLYTKKDAEFALAKFKPIAFGQRVNLTENFHLEYHHAGHILGAAFVQLTHDSTRLLFSGDIGRFDDAVMRAPEAIQSTDYLILESTYGNRLHSENDPMSQVEEVVNRTVDRGGTLVIPAFAVGRAQTILFYLYQLKKEHRIPDIPVFLDSPMAISATEIFCRYPKEHHLSKEEARLVSESARYVRTVDESKALDQMEHPVIIISASGMATGGRVLHHLKVFAPDPKNSILLTGFQAAGTRGARLFHGEKQIKMLGEYVPINAEVYNLENTSAHADQDEILNWLGHFSSPPKKVFLTHGETKAVQALQDKIIERYGWTVKIPKYLQCELL